jgi:hypothetical protein
LPTHAALDALSCRGVWDVRVDTGSANRRCKGVSSKQWELGTLGLVGGVHDSELCVWKGGGAVSTACVEIQSVQQAVRPKGKHYTR